MCSAVIQFILEIISRHFHRYRPMRHCMRSTHLMLTLNWKGQVIWITVTVVLMTTATMLATQQKSFPAHVVAMQELSK